MIHILCYCLYKSDIGNTDGSAMQMITVLINGTYKFSNKLSLNAGYGWKNPDNINDVWRRDWLLCNLNDAFIDGNNLGLGSRTAETHRNDSYRPIGMGSFFMN